MADLLAVLLLVLIALFLLIVLLVLLILVLIAVLHENTSFRLRRALKGGPSGKFRAILAGERKKYSKN